MPAAFAQPVDDRLEQASLDELRHHQLQRLRQSLTHAYNNVPWYREQFHALDVHPYDLNQLEDLARFPLTSKAELRDHYPFGLFAVPMDQVSRLHASSGTTGKPTVVGYTRNDIDVWSSLVARSIRAAGGKQGDRIHIAYGYGLFTGGLGAHYGAEKLGCTVIPMSGGQTARQVQLLKDFQPDIIMVTPSYMLNIAEEIERQGINPHDLALRVGIFGAEPWGQQMRVELEQRLGIQALDIYGLSEVMGPGVAMEHLDTKDGPTLWEDHFYPEIINPETGEVLPEGQFGELVLTTLSKEALPMVRYRTRDLTRLLPGSGRAMRRLDKITGRSDDMLIIRGVNVFPSQIEEQLLKLFIFSPVHELHVSREGNLDSLTVQVEMRPEHSRLSSDEQLAACQQLSHQIKVHVGISTRIVLQPCNTLKRSEGKAGKVIDLRGTR
ncbi:phenylacetate--CoA ligase PaaK [Pseudomonas rubra]|uniref:Phenylacetate-coenzyme A ligase n=1 Tax=Pseudomonas rubra TaxID=2942627 RepID=A0ABT5PEN0_9PSED|nr:phenylacetate--CoA ligase PaaK [Pseudomonas rubra]MDD1016660.1 phenylacetate--CoA ligase [Pseudomonas rubra]MDD1040998.1 phenylacetate--CoA ligase [Pseudomonas rubra]MDD1153554.1 phenylacetate--CoA ligase [Pseudomonas rubra]